MSSLCNLNELLITCSLKWILRCSTCVYTIAMSTLWPCLACLDYCIYLITIISHNTWWYSRTNAHKDFKWWDRLNTVAPSYIQKKRLVMWHYQHWWQCRRYIVKKLLKIHTFGNEIYSAWNSRHNRNEVVTTWWAIIIIWPMEKGMDIFDTNTL